MLNAEISNLFLDSFHLPPLLRFLLQCIECLYAGNTELMEYLLSKGAEVESQSDAGTPLIWAAGHGQPDALKVLLEHHANVNPTPQPQLI